MSQLARDAKARGIDLSQADAQALRRAEMTLRRWALRECGDGSGTHIERNGTTGIPYEVADRSPWFQRINDNESAALQRVSALCERLGIYYHHQQDPRGPALFIAAEPMTDSDYSSVGVPCTGER